MEDSYALSVARKQTLTSLLRLLNAYHDESDYTVLSHVTSVSKSCTSSGWIILKPCISNQVRYMHCPCFQVCLSISKISVDATPDLNNDIKKLLINLLLPAAMYANNFIFYLFQPSLFKSVLLMFIIVDVNTVLALC